MIELIRQESEAGHHSVVKMYQILDIPRATYYRKINPIPSKKAQEQELNELILHTDLGSQYTSNEYEKN